MDPFVEVRYFVDVNDAGLIRYRAEIEAGGETPARGEGYSLEEATRNAVTAAVQAVTG
jgi:hypothetical protein